MTLEGNVVPGKSTTYWLDTDAGRRPATGPSLVQVADETNATGAIVIDTWTCPIGVAQAGFDWFGQCTTPAVDMQFSVYPATGGTTPLATSQANRPGSRSLRQPATRNLPGAAGRHGLVLRRR